MWCLSVEALKGYWKKGLTAAVYYRYYWCCFYSVVDLCDTSAAVLPQSSQSLGDLTALSWVQWPPPSSCPNANATRSWPVPTTALWPPTCTHHRPWLTDIPESQSPWVAYTPVRLLPRFPGTGPALAWAIQWTSAPPSGGYSHTLPNKVGNPAWCRRHPLPSLSFLRYSPSVSTRVLYF